MRKKKGTTHEVLNDIESEPLNPPEGNCCSYTQSMKPCLCTGLNMDSSAEGDPSEVSEFEGGEEGEGRRASEERQKYPSVILERLD
jgi:hypothetical protein